MPNSNLKAALDYAQRGWRVFPLFYILKTGECSCKKKGCTRAGKHPVNRDGCLGASTDAGQIRQWWTEMPHANIGLATGHDGLVVVDVDNAGSHKDGSPKVGSVSLQTLIEQFEALPPTLVVQTGSGGQHYYFLTTEVIPNSTSKIALDIDVRGVGGYVILPPSNHASGGHYEWLVGPDIAIADMPNWLERLATVSRVKLGKEDALQPEVIEDARRKDKYDNATPEQIAKLLDYISPDCNRDRWWQVGAVLKKELGEKRGFELWDDWSSKAPDKYDAKAQHAQWRSFEDKGLTLGTLFHFAKEEGFRGFDVEAADAPELKANWVYAASIKRFIRTTDFMEWDTEQFNAMFARQFTRGKPADHVLKNPNFKLVDGVTYWPEKELFVYEAEQEKLNYWRPAGIHPQAGDAGPFINHIKYLFPSDKDEDFSTEARILLQYLAFQVQHPGEKVHWAVLLEGEQGNGKSYFGTAMRAVLGQHNVRMVHNDQLHETFSQWQRNTQLVVVEEMMARGRLELMNKLKPMITENYCVIREMYRPAYEQANRFNFLFFSNHPDSLILDSTDRRYCILKSIAPPHPERNAYYGPLFDWTRHNAAVLLHFLKYEVSLDGFQPKAHAPMTLGKRALIAQSMQPLDAFIFEKVEAQEYPFRWDLHSTSQLVEPLSKFNLRVNPKEIGNAFARLGYASLGRQRVGGNEGRVYFWAVREFDTYANMSAPQLRQVWLSQQNGADPGAVTDETINSLANQRPLNAYTAEEAM